MDRGPAVRKAAFSISVSPKCAVNRHSTIKRRYGAPGCLKIDHRYQCAEPDCRKIGSQRSSFTSTVFREWDLLSDREQAW